jgi:hypothetical protein
MTMAVLVIQEFPATIEQYDQVTEKIDAENNPPDGLILHSGADMGGGTMKVVDIWDSEDAWNSFLEGRLGPAVAEVMGTPPEGAGPPPIEVRELRDLVQP